MAHFLRVPHPPPPAPEAPCNLMISGWTGHPKKEPKWFRKTLADLDAGLAVLDEVEAELDRQERDGSIYPFDNGSRTITTLNASGGKLIQRTDGTITTFSWIAPRGPAPTMNPGTR